jgi:uncharacterized protein
MALQKSKIEPRSTIFVDTSAFVGSLVPDDEFHEAATKLFEEIVENRVHLVTTEMVLFELANGLSKVRYRQSAFAVIDDLITLDDTTVAWSSSELFDSAYDIYKSRPDKDWSLTDCASFVVMKERNISLAFTSDKHFEQAGFVRLLEVLES